MQVMCTYVYTYVTRTEVMKTVESRATDRILFISPSRIYTIRPSNKVYEKRSRIWQPKNYEYSLCTIEYESRCKIFRLIFDAGMNSFFSHSNCLITLFLPLLIVRP